MEICVIRRRAGIGLGGAEGYCHRLCAFISSQGVKVRLLSEYCHPELAQAVDWVPIPTSLRGSTARNLLFHHRVQQRLGMFPRAVSYALSRTYPVDAYRITDPLHAHTVATRYQGRLLGVLTRIGPRHRVLLRLERGAVEGSRALVAISRLDQRLVKKYYGVDQARIEVIYNGVDQGLFSPARAEERQVMRSRLGVGPDESLYLFAGNDFERKGLDTLIKALAPHTHPWRLLVAGGDRPAPFVRLARRLEIEGKVTFMGKVSSMAELYRAADLFIFPTRYDPFGNVHLEALSSGVPVITTAQAGGAEVIKEGENGFVLKDCGDWEELSHLIGRFESMRPNWAILRDRARASVDEFTIERNAVSTLELLARIRK